MRYANILTMMAAGVLLFTGCSPKNPDPDQLKSECTINGEEAPRWACGLHHDDKYYAAVGTAKIGKLGFGFARKEALADARANLSHQVALDVKARTTQFARSTGVDDDETVERVVEAVTKQVARVTLHDSRQEAYWEHPSDGSIYLLVKVDKDKVDEAARQAILSSYRNDDALWQQFQAKQALKALDEEFPGKR